MNFAKLSLTLCLTITLLQASRMEGSAVEQPNEYGVILLPEDSDQIYLDELTSSLKKSFDGKNVQYSNIANIPHVSIFQGVFEEQKLSDLQDSVKTQASTTKPLMVKLDKSLQDTNENIFLNFEDATSLKQVSQRFFDEQTYKYRSPNKVMSQVFRDIKTGVDAKNIEYIHDFGIYWNIPSKFNPHFTLVYGSNENDEISSILNATIVESRNITFTKMAVAKLGFEGNVVRIISQYNLGS